jgi:hypothetical protein
MTISQPTIFDHLERTRGFAPSDGSLGTPLVLDLAERRILASGAPPFLAGEILLLRYLGARPGLWHTTESLSERVYNRRDRGGRQLVWKYSSTLRQKIARFAPTLIRRCRRRGYCAESPIVVRDIDFDAVASEPSEVFDVRALEPARFCGTGALPAPNAPPSEVLARALAPRRRTGQIAPPKGHP